MKSLGEMIKIIKGNKATEVVYQPKAGFYRYIQIEDLRPNANPKYAYDEVGILAKKSDVLIAWDGANAGTVSFDLEGYIGSTIAILRPLHDDMHTPYLGYFLRSKFDEIQSNTSGATIPHINREHLENLRFPFPPLPEQQRIAAILQKADRLRRLRRYARRLSDTYLQSVFLEMFGNPVSNPKKWSQIALGEKIKFLTSGSRGWAEFYATKGDIFLRIQNVGRNKLLLDDLTFVQPPKNTEGERTNVKPGDLLISITADLGRTAVIPPGFPKAYINQHLALVRLEGINPIFVSGYISSPGGQQLIKQLDKSAVKSGLNFDDIKGFKVFSPPLEKQDKYVNVVNEYQKFYGQITESECQGEHLFQSLLHRAFRGEL
jgi:type I restriction enzyme S subunit